MGLAHSRSEHEASVELDTVQQDTRLGGPVMFDLILRFLQTPGQVLLIQGPPGARREQSQRCDSGRRFQACKRSWLSRGWDRNPGPVGAGWEKGANDCDEQATRLQRSYKTRNILA